MSLELIKEVGLFDDLETLMTVYMSVAPEYGVEKKLEQLVYKEIERCLITVDTSILEGLADQEKAKRSLKTSKKPPVNRWSKKK